jgi:hypothetical protein
MILVGGEWAWQTAEENRALRVDVPAEVLQPGHSFNYNLLYRLAGTLPASVPVGMVATFPP